MEFPAPSKDNDYLGFCPSAIKLQHGDRRGALKKRTEYHDSFSTSGVSTYICSTKGCLFQGHVSVDFVWKVVMKDEQLGLQCRWSFLAKSHVMQASVSGKQYHYQCPICIYSQGHAEGMVWNGTNLFLDHVSTHRGKAIPSEVLHKLNVINEYVAEEKENFDLNLFPPGFDSNASGHTSSNSSLSLSRAPTHSSTHSSSHHHHHRVWSRKESTIDLPHTNPRRDTVTTLRDRADSAVARPGAERTESESSEPWSTGLSTFHAEKDTDYLTEEF
ncbi:hypothetical protein BAUCODRAFT_513401 [Baudoinia panamericana UAMH 10762]|uniref:Uncharacterized protein n=1 Tax=Baudoinia panamericana (strain UAMH 10762) TaxID=717646 RepID=M2NA73_BAUPA|nr:uncharacterized protein BAUCODRAFT_513401 [Baudoinia panamericana UAMH 10762]EMC96019.1 hypothetical protein BAUCODRAFT_513401 [Baudoinia panamericana UAMH 10762]